MKKKILLIAACSLLFFTGCSLSKKTATTEEKQTDIKLNESVDFKTSYVFNTDKDIILSVTNNTSDLIDYANIYIAMYDKDGKLIKTSEQLLQNIQPNQENILKLAISYLGENQQDVVRPEKAEITLAKVNYDTKYTTVYNSNVTGTLSDVDESNEITLTLNNNSGKTIDMVQGSVVFYKNSKIVDAVAINSTDLGATSTQKVSVPTITSKNQTDKIDYDEAKFVVNSAFTYNEQ